MLQLLLPPDFCMKSSKRPICSNNMHVLPNVKGFSSKTSFKTDLCNLHINWSSISLSVIPEMHCPKCFIASMYFNMLAVYIQLGHHTCDDASQQV